MAGFDWVTARSECSLKRVFMILAEVIDSDVKAANELKIQRTQFAVNRDGADKVIVIRSRQMGGEEIDTVTFQLRGDRIVVYPADARGPRPPLFSASASLNQDGECFVEVDGQPLKLWQVSRKALEDLFFGE